MKFDIITIFPEIIRSYLSVGVLGRAIHLKNILTVDIWNPRDFTTNKHLKVDDTPYSGGAGMILQIEPIYNTLENIINLNPNTKKHIIFFKAGGTVFNQTKIYEYLENFDHIIMICGRYEGIDYRVEQFLSNESLSIGKFVLTGGELPAMIVLDAVSRYIPNVLGNENSLKEESHSQINFLEYPQYSKPAKFIPKNPNLVKISPEEWLVPETLYSGNHKEIKNWKKNNSNKN